jgi:hypothetical protein
MGHHQSNRREIDHPEGDDMTAHKQLHHAAPLAGFIAASFLSIGVAAAQAQNPSPPPAAPTTAPDTTAKPDCDSPSPTRARAGGANIAVVAGQSLQHKNWQPIGGLIEFTINSVKPIDADAPVTTCFRWKTIPPQENNFIEAVPTRLELSNQGKTLKVTVAVPEPLETKTTSPIDRAVWVVPLAEVRTLVLGKGEAGTLDVWSVIGITRPVVALFLALLAVALGLYALYRTAGVRITHEGINKANWFLRIISTPSATASLSQLQIVLWTFVVLASAVYVALLSGQLIEITTGTLVLLGISGLATLGTQAHNAGQLAAKQNAADTAAKELDAATAAASTQPAAAPTASAPAPAAAPSAATATSTAAALDDPVVKAEIKADDAQSKVDAVTRPPESRTPKWTDLLVNESDDGRREIDVTRAQVLLFTVITAGFVLITVIATYVIPEIPQGFLILMGISNGVYIGSKVVQTT